MNELHDLRKMLCDELKEYGKKELSAGSLATIDTLAHALKNLDKVIEEDGYSGHYYPYEDGVSRGYDRSYARGRDGMGRYSRSNLTDKLRELMAEAPDDRSRTEIKRLIDKME